MDKTTKEKNLNLAVDQFWDTVPSVWNLIRSHLRSIAVEQYDISVVQFHVLRLIRKGYTSVRDIADARQISCSAISQAADILVEKGLITRWHETEDRRFIHLALTPQGEGLLNQLLNQNRTWMIEKMKNLKNEDLRFITKGLGLLKTAFEVPSTKITNRSDP